MTQGRWPTNVILAPDMAAVLDQQSGFSKSSTNPDRFIGVKKFNGSTYAGDDYSLGMESGPTNVYADEGGASRFFTHAWYEPEELAWIYAVGLTPYGQEH